MIAGGVYRGCVCVSGGEDEAGPPPAPPAGSRRCVRELIHRERGRCLPHSPRTPTHPPARAAAAAAAPPRSPAGPRHGGGRGGLRGGGRRREGAEDGFARAPRAGRRPLTPRRPASPSPGGCSRRGQGRGAAAASPRAERGRGTEPAGRGGAREAGTRAARGCIGTSGVGRWVVGRGMVSILFPVKPTSVTKPQIPFLCRNHRGRHLRRCGRAATRGGDRRHTRV